MNMKLIAEKKKELAEMVVNRQKDILDAMVGSPDLNTREVLISCVAQLHCAFLSGCMLRTCCVLRVAWCVLRGAWCVLRVACCVWHVRVLVLV